MHLWAPVAKLPTADLASLFQNLPAYRLVVVILIVCKLVHLEVVEG
jgi:hypothetical protein